MLPIHDLKTRNAQRVAAMLALTCLSLVAISSPLLAQDTWLLKISEKELQLANPNDPMWMKSNMWDISFQRMNDRNMPTLELSNIQPVGSPDITQFRMTIGDTRFHFSDGFMGEAVVLGNTTPGFDLDSSISPDGNELIVNIVGGLAPGELVRFKIDLDVDPGHPDPPFFIHPDFRTVLFDMNGIQFYDGNIVQNSSADNAQARVQFSDGSFADPATFIDEVVTGPEADYYNDIFRPYGIMEGVDI
ncbi:MAG: hypothetical protein L0Z53_07495, partial [Acidobacteriales bacterium]|nr:hypothetical protein [Terriglobales bacterium]